MRWHVFGGSWGSTLALAYAQAHPERVSALVLRGIFLGSKREIEWFLYGMGRLYPEHWRNFVAAVPEHERDDLMTAFEKRLKIGRAHVCTTVTNAQLVCRLLLEKKKHKIYAH